ncbi:putrescine transport system substrate-binding protein [Pseudomonas sp. ok272]|uniref:polyamine ABC transporter substrate-binding protein n=1 Tax=unclassified Pseudomonas TaxID=196821 RepID=UPI0008AB6CDB|nr:MULTISPECIES: polyamine ABC transporter substrate-binding protein [unclassified Pseudomonas]SEN11382.1 putrescine transport system substrate-binding protein [Pseudomonas sp. ok272]SFN04465.1 putrescine transport system substrate-binding protein [Pseudomonas sp. ok602]
MNRLTLLFGIAIAVTASISSAAPQQVRIFNWSELIGQNTLKDFQDQTGIQVQYDTFDNESTLQVKLLTGNSGYDVVVPSGSSLDQLITAGALAELDRSKLPNWKNLDPELMQFVEGKDPGNRHAFIYDWGTTGLGINQDLIKARMSDAPLDSYDLLFKPEVVSRFKDCGVGIIDSPEDVYPIVLNYLGLDPQQPTQENLAKANTLLEAIRPNLRYINSGSYINDLANANICLMLGWSGDVEIAGRRAQEAGKNDHIRYIAPREGTSAWFGFMAMPKGAPNPEAAYRFMNEILEPRVSADFTATVGYANAVPASLALLPEAVAQNPTIFPSQAVRSKMFWQSNPTATDLRLMTRAWNRFKSGL